MGIKLPGGFSPRKALNQVGDTLNPFDGKTDYDVFSDVSVRGGDRSPADGTFMGPQATSSNPLADTGAAGQVESSFTEAQAMPGTGVGGGGASAADLAYLDSQEGLLRDMLARSATGLNQGLANLSDSYNREVSNANQARSRALENFGVQREDTIRAKQGAIGQVDTNARTLNDSIRRILGLASGSGSSAYQFAAPNAIARQASGQRGRVLGDYAENERDLSLAEGRATEDFASLLEDLGLQRNQRESDLRAGVLQNEQAINQQLADVSGQRAQARGGDYSAIRSAQQPYADAIGQRQSQLDALFEQFRSPVLTPKQVNVQTPTMRDYMVDRAGINAQAQGGAAQYSPYAYFLSRQRDDDNRY